jgi:hypothetical protein
LRLILAAVVGRGWLFSPPINADKGTPMNEEQFNSEHWSLYLARRSGLFRLKRLASQ